MNNAPGWNKPWNVTQSSDETFVDWTHSEINAIMAGMGKGTLADSDIQAKGTEAVGSLKSVIRSDGKTDLYRKQSNGRWAKKDSSADKWGLTDPGEDDNITAMENKRNSSSLIPNAAAYLDNHFNVLLVALHGVGKTVSIMDLARERGLKFKYYSCSTLDPYTDLVGVPTPRDYCPECKLYFKDQAKCPECQGNTVESLKMVRPREVDEAEVIFFDEFNRADSKTQNALFEIMQFKTINGEPLPNLKACWAAINPPDDEQNYQVEAIDPAMLDRFDIYIDLTPKVSVEYMSRHMPKQIAAALKVWWDQHQDAINNKAKDAHSDYISPRRLEKIGLVWCATKNRRSVLATIPFGVQAEKRKLVDILTQAQAEVDKAEGVVTEYEDDDATDLGGANLGDRPAPQFTYRLANMKVQQNELADYLKDNPLHKPTHDKVAEQLRQGVGGEELVVKFGKILDALHAPILEAMVTSFPPAKVKEMRKGFIKIHEDNPTVAADLKSLYKVLSPGADSNWPTI